MSLIERSAPLSINNCMTELSPFFALPRKAEFGFDIAPVISRPALKRVWAA